MGSWTIGMRVSSHIFAARNSIEQHDGESPRCMNMLKNKGARALESTSSVAPDTTTAPTCSSNAITTSEAMIGNTAACRLKKAVYAYAVTAIRVSWASRPSVRELVCQSTIPYSADCERQSRGTEGERRRVYSSDMKFKSVTRCLTYLVRRTPPGSQVYCTRTVSRHTPRDSLSKRPVVPSISPGRADTPHPQSPRPRQRRLPWRRPRSVPPYHPSSTTDEAHPQSARLPSLAHARDAADTRRARPTARRRPRGVLPGRGSPTRRRQRGSRGSAGWARRGRRGRRAAT